MNIIPKEIFLSSLFDKNILLSYDLFDDVVVEHLLRNGCIIHKLLCDAGIANFNDPTYSSLVENNFEGLDPYLHSIKYDLVILSSDWLGTQELDYISKRKEVITEFIRPKLKLGGFLFIELKKNMEFLKAILHEIDTYCLVNKIRYYNSTGTVWVLCTYFGEKVSECLGICSCHFYLANLDVSFKINPHFGSPQSTCFRGMIPIGELNLTIPLFVFDFLLDALPENEKTNLKPEDIVCFGDCLYKPKGDERYGDLYDTDRSDEFYEKNKYGLYIKDKYFSSDPKKIEENAYRCSSQPLSNLKEELSGIKEYVSYPSGRYIVIDIHNLKVAAFIVGTILYLPKSKQEDYSFFKAQDDCIKSSDELISWACVIAEFLKGRGLSVSFKLTSDDIERIVSNIMYPKNKIGRLKDLIYSKQELGDYQVLKDFLDRLNEEGLILKEYERYFWNSAEYIRDYIKKITKKELTFNQCIGILYECLMRQMFPGREKGNEKVVEKFIPCNKKISEIRKEITKDIGRSEEDKEKDKKKDKKNGKYEQIIDKVKEYFF